jgi:YHS domain-containing protein
MRHRCTILAIVGGLAASTMAHASESDALAARHEGIGFWKAYTPQGFKGELDSYDPIGLIGGALIKADCSINWRDQDGKLYCFASATSLNYFQDLPKANIRKAGEAFERLTQRKPGS